MKKLILLLAASFFTVGAMATEKPNFVELPKAPATIEMAAPAGAYLSQSSIVKPWGQPYEAFVTIYNGTYVSHSVVNFDYPGAQSGYYFSGSGNQFYINYDGTTSFVILNIYTTNGTCQLALTFTN